MIHSLVATDICTGWTEAVPLALAAVRLPSGASNPAEQKNGAVVTPSGESGSRVVKRYSPPATPCDRLMA